MPNVLVCVKRVPAPGASIVLTPDELAIDTQFLGFTVSPHEECAVEEAVRMVETSGGRSTVLALGPEDADEQLRTALAMGVDDAVLIEAEEEWDPFATADAIARAVRDLEADGEPFDIVLFGNESADAGNYQVGVRVAHALGRPIAAGIKAIDVGPDGCTVRRGTGDGFDVIGLPGQVVLAVKEGINLPRYPTMRGRLRAAKAEIRRLRYDRVDAGLTTKRLHHPEQEITETVMLGTGADAVPRIMEILEEVGLL